MGYCKTCINYELCSYKGVLEDGIPDHVCREFEKRDFPLTNGDKIRAKSDEELARFLCISYDCDTKCPARSLCYPGHNGLEEWLQQPAEEKK